jgi:hypothetical protein
MRLLQQVQYSQLCQYILLNQLNFTQLSKLYPVLKRMAMTGVMEASRSGPMTILSKIQSFQRQIILTMNHKQVE